MSVTPPVRFNSKVTEGLLRGNDATISFDGGDSLGLVQEWQISFDRPLTRLIDLIEPNISFMELIPSGTLTLNSVAGPINLPTQACECIPHTVTLSPGSSYCGPIPVTYTLSNCLPTRFILRGSLSPELVLFSAVYSFIDVTSSNS